AFYERHGGKAVVISRFLPIVRTYVPFVAGMAQMSAREYLAYNIAGAVLWVGTLTYAGFFFGNIAWIHANLTAIIVAIVVVSLLPLVYAYVKSRRSPRPQP
ncbi:MAG TPA: VTT domain-containing protein, partial [Usitatibacter sp.]